MHAQTSDIFFSCQIKELMETCFCVFVSQSILQGIIPNVDLPANRSPLLHPSWPAVIQQRCLLTVSLVRRWTSEMD